MPYIRVDLDGMKHVPNASRLAGVSEAEFGWGLVQAWNWCWLAGSDIVTGDQLVGFMGADEKDADRVLRAMVAFGFGEKLEDGTCRVRGATKYLGITESRKQAGRAAQNAVGRDSGGKFTVKPPSNHRHSTVNAPALTPIHPTPNTHTPESKTFADASLSAPDIQTEKVSVRLKPLTELLVAEYLKARGSKYKHGGAKDAKALKSLLAVASDEEIVRRWRIGLASAGWLQTSTFAQLGSKWNDITGADNKPKRDITKGTFRAEDATAKDHDEGFAF